MKYKIFRFAVVATVVGLVAYFVAAGLLVLVVLCWVAYG